VIVVDTNVVAYLLLDGDRSKNARALLQTDSQWAAPILWRSEFRNVLALYLRKKYINAMKARELMSKAEQLLRGNEFQVPSTQILDLVENSTCSAYDCEFVALARDLGITLVTNDKQIVREFKQYAKPLKQFI